MHHTRTFLFAAEVVHGQRAVYFLFILSHIHKPLSSFVTLLRHNHSIHQFQQLFLPLDLLCEFAVPIPLAYRDIGAMASRAIFNSLRVLCQERFLPSWVTAKTFHGQSRIVLLGTKKKASCSDPPEDSPGAPNSACAALAMECTQRKLAIQTSCGRPSQDCISTAVMSETRRRRSVSSLGHTESSKQFNKSCHLCYSSHSHVSSPSEWKSVAAKQYVQSLQVPQNVLVCRPCRDDITRAACNPGYIPRWEKGRKENNNSGVTCFVKLCEKPIFAKAAVKGGSTCIELKPNAPHPLPLCKAHYHTV